MALTLSGVLLFWTLGRAQPPQNAKVVQSEVSIAEIERTLRAIDVCHKQGVDVHLRRLYDTLYTCRR